MSLFKQLAAEIHGHGIRTVFGITGSGATLTLLDELEQLGVGSVRTHFEGCAALMAGTVGRLTNRAGVAFSIKGPGLANMVPGITASFLESFPLVAICEAYPPSGSRKAHKWIDQPQLVGPIAKGERSLGRGTDFSALATWAQAEVPGPVILQLTGDETGDQRPIPEVVPGHGNADGVLRLLEGAQRPVVIAGTLAIRAGWGRFLTGLRVPTFSTAAAKGVLDETSMQSAGVYTGVGLELTPERTILPDADLVVCLGVRPSECLSQRPFPCGSINIDPVIPVGSEAFQFSARTSRIPDGFWETLSSQQWGMDVVESSRVNLRNRLLEGFLPGAAFATIEELLGRDIRLVLDTGNFCTIGEHTWRAQRDDLCLLSGQARYMGTSVPMALGAAIHDSATPVVAVAGDGGIAMYLAEIRIAVERRLPVLFVLMSDGRFGSIAGRALKEGLTLNPIDIPNSSWMAVMSGLGLSVWRATTSQELRDALSSWRPGDGPGYLEISFDSEECQRMCNGIR